MGKEDRAALGALIRAMPHAQLVECRHFIYLPQRAKGVALAQRLRDDGFSADCRLGADGKNWLVLAKHLMVPDEDALESIGEQLRILAVNAGGEYDGWEAGS